MVQNVSENRTVKDPVCGMDVITGRARGWDYLYQEIVYHFCGPDCRSRFQVDPKGVLKAGPGQPRASAASTTERERKTWWSPLRRLFK